MSWLQIAEALEEAERRYPREAVARIVRRNRAGAIVFLRRLAREGRTSPDPLTDEVLLRLRRDLAREAGLDERIVRSLGGAA